MRPMRWLLLGVAVTAFGCARAKPEAAAQPPVIIISIDTLRSDHLPAYGYRGVRTPAIDAFARESLVFEHAYSHCPLTLPSHATILTGLLPAETGIRDNAGFRLDPKRATLAEVLGRNGYATGAAVSAYVLRADTGINRGFDFFDDHIIQRADQSLGGIQRSGVETESVAEKWLGDRGAQPFFFMLHLYEPHAPYDAPEPFRSQFKPYDAEIAAADAIVGRFLEALKARGLYDRALIVLLSDHGEGLGDHGEDEHGIFLYREAIQVPLMVKLPGSTHGARVSETVGLRDVMPAILDELHIALPPGLEQRSIFRDVKPHTVYSETFYPRFHFGWSDLHSLTDGAKHYIQAPRPELYDVKADPGETANLVESDRRTFAAMKSAIAPMITAAAAPAAIAPEEAAKLAALGYIGSSAAAGANESLADPKDKRETFRELRGAFSLFRAGKNADALEAFRKILRENPRMTDVWDVTAKTYWRMGRQSEAIDAAKEGLKTNPQSSVLAMTVAEFALQSGRFDEARQHAELALPLDAARANDLLARIALARGDVAAAERSARLATAGGGDRAAAYVTLARVLKKAGRDSEALAAADEAARVVASGNTPPFAGLSFLRGDLLARLGRNEEAAAAFRQEIALAPADARAYQSLIVLLLTEGRGEQATPLVFQLIDRAPTAENFAAIVETMKTVGDMNGARYWAAKGLQKFPHDPRFQR
jgi:arylsulfatase A-like enzyme/tetratricopeptide (TPR) repeat protein